MFQKSQQSPMTKISGREQNFRRKKISLEKDQNKNNTSQLLKVGVNISHLSVTVWFSLSLLKVWLHVSSRLGSRSNLKIVTFRVCADQLSRNLGIIVVYWTGSCGHFEDFWALL